MRTVELSPTSIATTRLGFGCGGLLRLPSDQERRRLLDGVFDLGVRHFDTARMYGLGAAERELAPLLRAHRAEVTVATKFGIDLPGGSATLGRVQAPLRKALARFPRLRAMVKRRADAAYEARSYDAAAARASLETSLRELGTDYVDILFLHGPQDVGQVPFEELGDFLEGARAAGQIRAWGVAGGREPSVAVAERLPAPVVRQLAYDVSKPLPPGAGAALVFDVLAGPMEHLREAFEPAELSSMLIREALASNPEAVVLFGTTRLDHAEQNVRAASAEADDAAVERFRDLVRAGG
jgi:aryl-alcohol dehydrogenase-like predicted oxidoreductase